MPPTQSGSVVLLKGADTLIADAGGGRVAVVDTHTPGLATAGTGDVLTGVVAAFLAKGLDPLEAATVRRGRARAGRVPGRQSGWGPWVSSRVT